MKTAISDSVIENDGEADFARALEGGFHGGEALFEVANDVFDHHDRIVDHEADPIESAMSERLSRL